jgi:hypothetical protein
VDIERVDKEMKMNKMLLVAITALTAVMLSSYVSGASTKDGDQGVSETASQIADFTLPSGYTTEFAGKLGDYTAVSYNPGDGHSHLYLIQSENSDDREKLSEMLSSLVSGSSDRYSRMTVVESRTATIRGQAATVVISDGVNSAGQKYRQVTAGFEGKGGPALLVIEEPLTRWDQGTVDAFIASLR